jgi:Na+/melibiose symporter-like transporter
MHVSPSGPALAKNTGNILFPTMRAVHLYARQFGRHGADRMQRFGRRPGSTEPQALVIVVMVVVMVWAHEAPNQRSHIDAMMVVMMVVIAMMMMVVMVLRQHHVGALPGFLSGTRRIDRRRIRCLQHRDSIRNRFEQFRKRLGSFQFAGVWRRYRGLRGIERRQSRNRAHNSQEFLVHIALFSD